MRHKRKINHLGRTDSHRKALLSNMAASLILHKRISTTVQKAKMLRRFVEPILTRAKNDTTHSRRMVFRKIQDKKVVSSLFRDVAPKIDKRPGGYLRILKTGFRPGDNAEMCFIELVDFNQLMLAAKEIKDAKATKKTRRGRGMKKDKTELSQQPAEEQQSNKTTEQANPDIHQGMQENNRTTEQSETEKLPEEQPPANPEEKKEE